MLHDSRVGGTIMPYKHLYHQEYNKTHKTRTLNLFRRHIKDLEYLVAHKIFPNKHKALKTVIFMAYNKWIEEDHEKVEEFDAQVETVALRRDFDAKLTELTEKQEVVSVSRFIRDACDKYLPQFKDDITYIPKPKKELPDNLVLIPGENEPRNILKRLE